MLGWLSVAHAKVGRCHEEFEMSRGMTALGSKRRLDGILAGKK